MCGSKCILALSYLALALYQTLGTLGHRAFVSRDVSSNEMEELADGRTAHAQQGTDKREQSSGDI